MNTLIIYFFYINITNISLYTIFGIIIEHKSLFAWGFEYLRTGPGCKYFLIHQKY